MPKSKAEWIVELREQMKGTPYKMPLSHMKLHELETASMTLAQMKAGHTANAAAIPDVVRSGRPASRPVAPAVAEDDEDEDTIKVPQPPAPRLKKAPLIRTAKDPENHPLGRPPKAKKVEIEEPLKGKSPRSHVCNCPDCGTRK